uniref:Dentin sialophosphoprotein-like n=1 Tax=Saccoglossus kowalevskii TaxID=10224 RepID=A0ABM0MRA8_SACKO|nr:PREDICTED: dentin sialophosphoprotein-like [Saccoglossus kowalevskii]
MADNDAEERFEEDQEIWNANSLFRQAVENILSVTHAYRTLTDIDGFTKRYIAVIAKEFYTCPPVSVSQQFYLGNHIIFNLLELSDKLDNDCQQYRALIPELVDYIEKLILHEGYEILLPESSKTYLCDLYMKADKTYHSIVGDRFKVCADLVMSAWTNPALVKIVSGIPVMEEEAFGFVSQEGPRLMSQRIKMLTANDLIEEALHLAKCCADHPKLGKDGIFFRMAVYLMCKQQYWQSVKHELDSKSCCEILDLVKIFRNVDLSGAAVHISTLALLMYWERKKPCDCVQDLSTVWFDAQINHCKEDHTEIKDRVSCLIEICKTYKKSVVCDFLLKEVTEVVAELCLSTVRELNVRDSQMNRWQKRRSNQDVIKILNTLFQQIDLDLFKDSAMTYYMLHPEMESFNWLKQIYSTSAEELGLSDEQAIWPVLPSTMRAKLVHCFRNLRPITVSPYNMWDKDIEKQLLSLLDIQGTQISQGNKSKPKTVKGKNSSRGRKSKGEPSGCQRTMLLQGSYEKNKSRKSGLPNGSTSSGRSSVDADVVVHDAKSSDDETICDYDYAPSDIVVVDGDDDLSSQNHSSVTTETSVAAENSSISEPKTFLKSISNANLTDSGVDMFTQTSSTEQASQTKSDNQQWQEVLTDTDDKTLHCEEKFLEIDDLDNHCETQKLELPVLAADDVTVNLPGELSVERDQILAEVTNEILHSALTCSRKDASNIDMFLSDKTCEDGEMVIVDKKVKASETNYELADASQCEEISSGKVCSISNSSVKSMNDTEAHLNIHDDTHQDITCHEPELKIGKNLCIVDEVKENSGSMMEVGEINVVDSAHNVIDVEHLQPGEYNDALSGLQVLRTESNVDDVNFIVSDVCEKGHQVSLHSSNIDRQPLEAEQSSNNDKRHSKYSVVARTFIAESSSDNAGNFHAPRRHKDGNNNVNRGTRVTESSPEEPNVTIADNDKKEKSCSKPQETCIAEQVDNDSGESMCVKEENDEDVGSTCIWLARLCQSNSDDSDVDEVISDDMIETDNQTNSRGNIFEILSDASCPDTSGGDSDLTSPINEDKLQNSEAEDHHLLCEIDLSLVHLNSCQSEDATNQNDLISAHSSSSPEKQDEVFKNSQEEKEHKSVTDSCRPSDEVDIKVSDCPNREEIPYSCLSEQTCSPARLTGCSEGESCFLSFVETVVKNNKTFVTNDTTASANSQDEPMPVQTNCPTKVKNNKTSKTDDISPSENSQDKLVPVRKNCSTTVKNSKTSETNDSAASANSQDKSVPIRKNRSKRVKNRKVLKTNDITACVNSQDEPIPVQKNHSTAEKNNKTLVTNEIATCANSQDEPGPVQKNCSTTVKNSKTSETNDFAASANSRDKSVPVRKNRSKRVKNRKALKTNDITTCVNSQDEPIPVQKNHSTTVKNNKTLVTNEIATCANSQDEPVPVQKNCSTTVKNSKTSETNDFAASANSRDKSVPVRKNRSKRVKNRKALKTNDTTTCVNSQDEPIPVQKNHSTAEKNNKTLVTNEIATCANSQDEPKPVCKNCSTTVKNNLLEINDIDKKPENCQKTKKSWATFLESHQSGVRQSSRASSIARKSLGSYSTEKRCAIIDTKNDNPELDISNNDSTLNQNTSQKSNKRYMKEVASETAALQPSVCGNTTFEPPCKKILLEKTVLHKTDKADQPSSVVLPITDGDEKSLNIGDEACQPTSKFELPLTRQRKEFNQNKAQLANNITIGVDEGMKHPKKGTKRKKRVRKNRFAPSKARKKNRKKVSHTKTEKSLPSFPERNSAPNKSQVKACRPDVRKRSRVSVNSNSKRSKTCILSHKVEAVECEEEDLDIKRAHHNGVPCPNEKQPESDGNNAHKKSVLVKNRKSDDESTSSELCSQARYTDTAKKQISNATSNNVTPTSKDNLSIAFGGDANKCKVPGIATYIKRGKTRQYKWKSITHIEEDELEGTNSSRDTSPENPAKPTRRCRNQSH